MQGPEISISQLPAIERELGLRNRRVPLGVHGRYAMSDSSRLVEIRGRTNL
jgi:hypothetical protein